MKLNFYIVVSLIFIAGSAFAQQQVGTFGEEVSFDQVTPGKKVKSVPIQWFQVNTNENTWTFKGEELICSGNPVGVIRTKDHYENFILHVEWKHMKAGGNSGVFVWSTATIAPNKLPDGIEAQILELDWLKLNTKDGVTPPEPRVHGEMFGMGGVKITADNPNGNKSFPFEFRCKGKGEWNTYDLVCIDGTIKLAVNGKFVNGISQSSQKKGYVCLESEGSEIVFRNIRITRLP